MTQEPRSKGRAIALFLVVLLLWLGTIINHTLGFIPPVSGEAVGFDLWACFMWGLFLFSARNLFLSFRSK